MSFESSQPSSGKSRRIFNWKPTILVYLLLMNSILLCLLFPTIAIYFFKQEKSFQSAHIERMVSQMRDGLEHHSSSTAHNLALSAGQAMAGFNFTFLNTLVGDVVKQDRQIYYCFVMDKERRVLAHNDVALVGGTLSDQEGKLAAAMRDVLLQARLSGDESTRNVSFFEHSIVENGQKIRILEAVAPVYSGAGLVGFLCCGFSLLSLDEEIAGVIDDWSGKTHWLKVSFTVITLLFFVLGALVAIIFTSIFVRSVRFLSDGVDKVATGDLYHTIRQQDMVCSEFVKLSSSFNLMTEELRSSHKRLRDLNEYTQTMKEEESRRIAAIVHDQLGQTLSLLKLDVAWVKKRLPEKLREPIVKLQTMMSLIDSAIGDVQNITSQLRPPLLDDLGLASAIEAHIVDFRKRSGISCEVDVPQEDIILEQAVSSSLFRVFKEALINIVRHAEATRVWVSLKLSGDGLDLVIRDNGKGISESEANAASSFGVLAMRERIAMLGGRVEISGMPGKGTTVWASIPRSW